MYENDVYKTTRYKLKIQKWYCPNCSELIESYEDENKVSETVCPKCGAVIKKIRHSRHHQVIDIVMA